MLGSKLRAFRKSQRLTLVEVAAQSGLSVSFLSDIERGRAQPSLETLQKLADVYKVDMSKLLQGVDANPERVEADALPGLREFTDEVDVESEMMDLLLQVESRANPDQRAKTKEDWMRFYYSLKTILGR